MKLLPLTLLALLATVAVACGSDGGSGSDSGRQLPPTNGQYERVLELAPDDVATPDFTLRDAGGNVVSLSEFRGQQPFAIIFYRGFF